MLTLVSKQSACFIIRMRFFGGNLSWWDFVANKKWEFVVVVLCLSGILSWWDYVVVGICHGGIMSRWEFVVVGFCRDKLSSGKLSRDHKKYFRFLILA